MTNVLAEGDRRREKLMPQGFVIAIDGPVASGKGTVAKALSKRLNGFYMNTGGMYRAAALYCIENGIDINNQEAVSASLSGVSIDLTDDGVFLNGKDVTERIKEKDTDNGSSVVAVYQPVRTFMVARQQEIGKRFIDKDQIVVVEGRDAGTRIFPGAGIKIFLTASEEVRAKRRQAQYEAKGEHRELEEMREAIRIRDERDTTRAIDPLVSDPQNHGYWKVDDSNETPEETANRIVAELIRRGLIDDKN